MNKDYIIKQAILLFVIIVGSVLVIRYLSKGETLLDYANDNNIPIHSENTVDDMPAEQENTDK